MNIKKYPHFMTFASGSIINESKSFPDRGYVPEIFRDHVKIYERIGTYTDPEDMKTDIIIVYLQKETALDRARTTQRNFIARYLKDTGKKRTLDSSHLYRLMKKTGGSLL